MSDKRKKNRKVKETSKNADLSSTQCESDQSYIKDSGYISTTESIHRHRRSITIDLGHTKAKINAGVKEATADEEENGYAKETETSEICLPEVNEDKTVAKDEDEIENENSLSSSHNASIPSKLPILNSHRRRSNSMVLTSYTRTPRRNSISNGLQESSSEMQQENSISGTKRSPRDKSAIRQVGNGAEKGSGKFTHSGSNIPIYRAHSDGNLQEAGKPSPRLSQSLSTPAIPEVSDNFFLSDEQKMDRIVEHSSSSSDIPSDVNKFQSHSLDDLKLPSILLSRPHETNFAGRASTKATHPIISPRGKPGRSSIYRSPVRSRRVSPDLSLKLPLLQTPVRCRCSIEPYDFWDGRRTKSAVDCVANLHFLSEEELSQFDSRLFAVGGTSYSSGLRKKLETPTGYKAIRTQTLRQSKPGRKSAESVTFHVDHASERNTFKLPTEKLKKNKKFKVVFTIGKSGSKDKDKKAGDKKS